MDRKYAYFIFVGLVVGALFGLLWRNSGTGLVSLWVGALLGMAVGWFYAAYRSQKKS